MAYRNRVRVIYSGEKLPEVVTNARDYASCEQVAGDVMRPLDMQFQAVHSALLRNNVPGIPSSYATFLDHLDDFDIDEGADDATPTQPDH